MQDHPPPPPPGERIVLGRIRTMDPRAPTVRAMAVRGGSVVAVGSPEDARAALSPGHAVVDAGDRLVLPGFIDAHAHLVDGGLQLAALDLSGVVSRAEWDRRVSSYVVPSERPVALTRREVDPDARTAWITGGGWDHERWGGNLPDRGWLDPLTGSRPALLMRSDLHMALANSAALAHAGVDRDGRTPDPDGGQIVRASDGTATGILRDNAIGLVAARIPAPDGVELEAAVHRAVAHAHRLGVTQIHDMGELPPSWRDLEVLDRLDAAGALDLRVSVATPTSDWRALAERIRTRGRGSDRLRWGCVKGFVDGSLGAGTARFHEPFEDLPGSRGLIVSDPERLRSDVAEAWAAGIQPIVHAIGDAAVDWLVDVYAGLGPATGDVPAPRIEHAQHLGPETALRMARTGLIASMQPAHLVADAPWLERRLGAERARRAYAIRTLDRSGVPLAFGSDWTVASLDPLLGIRAAVDRVAVDGRVFGPEERITTERAVLGYTRGAAAAAGFRGRTGVLRPGAFADFVVLDGTAVEDGTPEDSYPGLGEARVVRTFVGGVEVYSEREGA